ncbi:hypothetical protein QCA50_004326 [Cerrena zonata]|uniref:Uncharacterized protein n=1 Tax=Cerrena zonata TaxID=2478898 RepID=A0AAW0GGY9_9APHY
MDDAEVIKGYLRWDEDNQFAHIFHDLEKIVINNCHPALPMLYRWKGHSETDKHPMHHKLAKKLESIHKDIPQGPLSKMKELGLQQMKRGDWLFARDLYAGGDAKDDLVQAFVPQDGHICRTTLDEVERAKQKALGPRESRIRKVGSLPVEQYEDGTPIQSVCSSERCYPLGVTYEKQTVYSAPNANSKIKNSKENDGTRLRMEVLKTTTQVYLEGWEEAPEHMWDTIADMTDMLAMPHIGSPENKWCSSVQLNIAQPRRYDSMEGLVEQRFFGGIHRDLGNLICSMSGMVSLSDHPRNYQGGHFHLISLGIYVVLDQIDIFYFVGHHLHSGMPPLAPEGEEEIKDWAYCCIVIFYPSSKMISGSTQVFMAGSGVRGEPVTLPREVFSHDPPRPFTSHANFFTDGAMFTSEKDHFTTSMYMLTLYIHHLLRQLPYEVHFDSIKFADCISAKIDNSTFTSEPWAHAPAKVINTDYTLEPLIASPDRHTINYPPSSQFPSHQNIISKFVNTLYISYAKAMPHMAMDGIIERIPAVLKPTDPKDNLNILRPTTNNDSRTQEPAQREGSHSQKKTAHKPHDMILASTAHHFKRMARRNDQQKAHTRAGINEIIRAANAKVIESDFDNGDLGDDEDEENVPQEQQPRLNRTESDEDEDDDENDPQDPSNLTDTTSINSKKRPWAPSDAIQRTNSDKRSRLENEEDKEDDIDEDDFDLDKELLNLYEQPSKSTSKLKIIQYDESSDEDEFEGESIFETVQYKNLFNIINYDTIKD